MATVEVSIDVTGLEALADRLRLAAETIKPKVAEALFANAKRTAVVAAGIASRNSKSIPPTLKALADGDRAIVQAGDGSSSLPALMERGSIHRPDPTQWRHPVFGNRSRWVSQKTHPYLLPAVLETRIENELRLVAAVTEAASETIGSELP